MPLSMARCLLRVRMIGLSATLLVPACSGGTTERSVPASGGMTLTPQEARTIAAEAYVYLYPMVQNYQTIYQFALNPSGPEFKGPMNTVFNVARVFTSRDRTIVTPNSDTPYSYLILDLRAEPYVVTLPRIEPTRYYSLQLVDLYTHNVDYLGTRKDGNDGGRFLIVGPDWQGNVPSGVTRVVRSPTSIMFGQYRTQLRDPSDLPRVTSVQAGYQTQPLSAFLAQPPPQPPPAIEYPPITQDRIAENFWRYANFLLQFAPALAGEEPLRDRFARIGVRASGPWPPPDATDSIMRAIAEGATEASRQLDTESRQLTSAAGLFGTPAAMAGKYKERALGALAGLYGNDVEETMYVSYQVDGEGRPLDTSKQRYTLTFAPGKLPPVNAFWSITMYDATTRLMVDNPIDRYLINSPMLDRLTRNPDGGLTLYLQTASPGAALANNWLPAPNGQMGAVLRMYLPRAEALSGEWQAPAIEIAGSR